MHKYFEFFKLNERWTTEDMLVLTVYYKLSLNTHDINLIIDGNEIKTSIEGAEILNQNVHSTVAMHTMMLLTIECCRFFYLMYSYFSIV